MLSLLIVIILNINKVIDENTYDCNLIDNSNNGTIDRPIVIRNYVDESGNHHTPIINFDGSAAISLGTADAPISHAEIAGFKRTNGSNDSAQARIAIGNDTDMRGSIRTGSIIVNEMQIAGS